MAKKPVQLTLVWTGEMTFRVRAPDGRELTTDGRSREGFSPVELLAAALGGCMAADVVHVLTRGRRPPRALRTSLTAQRAPSDPHRLVAVAIEFVAAGDVDPRQLERAVQLSRDKYCSVWSSLGTDTALDVVTRVEPDGVA
jgi:putative redox protein